MNYFIVNGEFLCALRRIFFFFLCACRAWFDSEFQIDAQNCALILSTNTTHFKFLSFLRHDDCPLNLPQFMYHILLKRAKIVQKGTPKDVSHNYFIKLIIEKALREQLGISWDDFI